MEDALNVRIKISLPPSISPSPLSPSLPLSSPLPNPLFPSPLPFTSHTQCTKIIFNSKRKLLDVKKVDEEDARVARESSLYEVTTAKLEEQLKEEARLFLNRLLYRDSH